MNDHSRTTIVVRWKALAATLLVALFLTCSALPGRAADFLIKDGDRPVTFLGDSITIPNMYTSLIEGYVLTRFPTWKVTFRNVGSSGDTAGLRNRRGIENGVKRDVLWTKPALVTIDMGMNDGRAGEKGLADYVANETKLTDLIKAGGASVILITSSPEERYEDNQPAGSAYNNILAKYSEGLKGVAEKEGVPFIDQFDPMVKVIEDGRKDAVLSATQGGPRLTGEGVHPNWAGHLVMAWAILKGMNAPSLVSHLEIDAATGKVTNAEKCTAEMIAGGKPDELQFKRTDQCLPMPVPTDCQMVLKKIPSCTALQDLSDYSLKVTNLKAGKYDLSIDGKRTATFTSDELANGVNLTLVAGPITDQALKVWATSRQQMDMFNREWMNVRVASQNLPDWLKVPDVDQQAAAELTKEDAQIAEMDKQMETLRVPVPHTFLLSPAA